LPAPDIAKEDKSSPTARVETLENEVSDLKHTVHHMYQKLDCVMHQLERLLSALPPFPTVPDVDSTSNVLMVPSEMPVSEKPNLISKTPETKSVTIAWNGTNAQIKVAPSISTPVPPKTPNATPSIKISDPQPRPKVIITNTLCHVDYPHAPCYRDVAGAEPKPRC
jgi:hypothetical protein